jgi:long-chain fatty acid transport protein
MSFRLLLRLVALGCAALLASAPRLVRAAGFETARFAGEHGHATGATPFALYYNPAALSLTRKFQAAAHLTLAVHGASFERKQSETGDGAVPGSNLGGARLRDVLVSPALALSYRIDDFTIGLGAFVPLAGQQDWDANGPQDANYRGVRDGVARWQLVSGTLASMYGSAGLSYQYSPLRISFGAAFNFNYNTLSLTRGLTPTGDDDIENEGRSYLDVRGTSMSLGFGALWETLRDKLWIGLSFQMPPGFYRDLRLDGELKTAFAAGAAEERAVSLLQSLPDVLRFSLRVRPRPSYELRFFGDYTRWSRFDKQCIVERGGSCQLDADGATSAGYESPLYNQMRKFHDTFGLHVGASYYVSEQVETLIGLAYDGNAIPLGTLDPSIIDGHDLSATLGSHIRLARRFGIYVAATGQTWFARDNTGKSRLAQYAPPSRLPSAGGEYRQWAVLFNTMLEVYLD